MNTLELEKLIYTLARPIVESQGLRIWGLELVAGPRLVVRLFVDIPLDAEKDGEHISATLGQCEEISRQLELAVEVEGDIERPWVLEVSSPGLERIFFELEQMRPYVGDLVDARLLAPVADGSDTGRKNWRGKLLEVGSEDFVIQPCSITDDGDIIPENGPECRIPWQKTRRVRRLHIFKTPRKPGGKQKRQ